MGWNLISTIALITQVSCVHLLRIFVQNNAVSQDNTHTHSIFPVSSIFTMSLYSSYCRAYRDFTQLLYAVS